MLMTWKGACKKSWAVRVSCLNIVLVLAKSTTCSLTMAMPLSSEALSSSTMLRMLGPYICLATAKIVDVFPVPGGP